MGRGPRDKQDVGSPPSPQRLSGNWGVGSARIQALAPGSPNPGATGRVFKATQDPCPPHGLAQAGTVSPRDAWTGVSRVRDGLHRPAPTVLPGRGSPRAAGAPGGPMSPCDSLGFSSLTLTDGLGRRVRCPVGWRRVRVGLSSEKVPVPGASQQHLLSTTEGVPAP